MLLKHAVIYWFSEKKIILRSHEKIPFLTKRDEAKDGIQLEVFLECANTNGDNTTE